MEFNEIKAKKKKQTINNFWRISSANKVIDHQFIQLNNLAVNNS